MLKSIVDSAALAFGVWSGVVKSKLENAMVEAIEMLQSQVTAFEEELNSSRHYVKRLEEKLQVFYQHIYGAC